ncbi:HIT domain-containing protein [Geobacter sulfurreducens]|uniref:Bis-adenosyl-polyphosphate hydrolase, FHIT domain-containing n=1 Tax=Geobacter sulfurreducens (strain ATCC 51573 / DSM 12127 / PCA) TaxID=243231 RepID=Q74CH2_GEOSL|nr:HIT domain-containing protein [Geobacter sulfurreducens]AAR35079.1 bis-adenosyl-polyphosphate hydrolase, FHIT domain-containing [Geobacter sulfurreducens PCA]ADI84537.2 bis-adenosyl-polyphosphate hydrolase, FHIT domain-containing [Geobacter sulfurreducens KN400]AJY71417.1 HIT family hydrolase [Geobacter sulfurreducens]QVW36857.1 HIT domain-containing protein [Geobacter sulfurreducens]UAC05696.1 HIT domain-containing protein [Geobacter sulfurreducens]
MERVWAPWRMEYLVDEKPAGCIFCPGNGQASDRERLILHRTPLSLVMLNRYPYTNGHLMVAPLRHTADMDSLSDAEMLDLFRTVRLCRSILRDAASPNGYNIGINLGKAAGAGVDDHLHIHVVPRWNGDTNFMGVVADLRVVPEGLQAAWDRLAPLFSRETP